MISEILKILSDPTRLRILTVLNYKNEAVCVGDVEVALQLSQPNASRHLKKLLQANLVVATKKTQFVYYELNTTLFQAYPFLTQLLDCNLQEMEQSQADIARLKALKPGWCLIPSE
ncbi:MAG: ArsR/SmtB family transcription factor [Culicoidibacterales bacterium]